MVTWTVVTPILNVHKLCVHHIKTLKTKYTINTDSRLIPPKRQTVQKQRFIQVAIPKVANTESKPQVLEGFGRLKTRIFKQLKTEKESREYVAQMLHVWYIYLHEWLKFTI